MEYVGLFVILFCLFNFSDSISRRILFLQKKEMYRAWAEHENAALKKIGNNYLKMSKPPWFFNLRTDNYMWAFLVIYIGKWSIFAYCIYSAMGAAVGAFILFCAESIAGPKPWVRTPGEPDVKERAEGMCMYIYGLRTTSGFVVHVPWLVSMCFGILIANAVLT